MACTARSAALSEVVYVPDIWWHATVAVGDTACIGGQRHKERLPSDWGVRLIYWERKDPKSQLAIPSLVCQI